MNTHKLLERLTQVQIQLTDRPENPYISMIEDVTETTLLIDNPFGEVEEKVVAQGQKIVCTIEDRDVLYQFEAKVLDHKWRGSQSQLVLAKPNDLTRVQRRQFFRLDVMLPIHYRTQPNLSARTLPSFKTSETRDISGGGVFFTPNDSLKKGTSLDLLIELPRKGGSLNQVARANIIVCVGKVVTIRNVEQQTGYGLEFISIEKRDRERIINFIFEEQTQRIRKLSRQKLRNY